MRTDMEPAPALGLPLHEPQPPAGCDVCASLVRQRATAAAAGDLSQVSDCNVEIRAHTDPHQRRQS
ncbi:hypothetical protein M2283_001638 [Streptomyces pseudovenezuelae]|uniref:Uncharacterized protein n=1 Tax=Streptomyces pseudovenezuelae TaxID=67350 RepID=A0ABT6LDG7_9ACTN|nr:hypothetical protein [Streptomyces pseudovenezuelae]MDH6214355.1 hypothetical protein [Streptomyces pseudovenezuelae]